MTRIRAGGFGTGRITPPAVNLARNPWPVDGTGCGFPYPSAFTAATVVGSGGPFGGPFFRVTLGTAATAANTDFVLYADNSWVAGSGVTIAGAIPVLPGDTHTWSFYVRTSRANPFMAQTQYLAGTGGASGTATSAPVTPVVNTWTRLSVAGTAGADAQALRCDVDLNTPVSWQAGDTVDFACFMISQGPALLPFSVGQHREL